VKNRNTAGIALVGIAVAVLAGCTGTEAPEESNTQAAPVAESASPSAEASTTPAAATDLPGEHTAPGSELALGDTALVNWMHFEHGEIALAVTVTDVREGSLTDFDDIGLDEETKAQIAGYTPFYIDASIVKGDLSQPAIEFSALSSNIAGLNAGGADLPSLTLLGSFPLCDSNSFEPSIDEGVAQTTCEIFLVPSGQEFGFAQWSDYDTPYDKYDGAPITWS